jgi:hypothetical protein
MQNKIVICDRNRIWCFETSSLLFLEWDNDMRIKDPIRYMLCIYVSLQDMYVRQERIRKKLLLKFKNFIMDGDINHELCTRKCILSYVKLVKWSRYLLRRFRTMIFKKKKTPKFEMDIEELGDESIFNMILFTKFF